MQNKLLVRARPAWPFAAPHAGRARSVSPFHPYSFSHFYFYFYFYSMVDFPFYLVPPHPRTAAPGRRTGPARIPLTWRPPSGPPTETPREVRPCARMTWPFPLHVTAAACT